MTQLKRGPHGRRRSRHSRGRQYDGWRNRLQEYADGDPWAITYSRSPNHAARAYVATPRVVPVRYGPRRRHV